MEIGSNLQSLCLLSESHLPSESAATFISKIFDTGDFPSRWDCGNWSFQLGWLHILSDVAIFVAYVSIPLSLMIFLSRRRDIALRGTLWLFVAFILSCGLTHLTDSAMFYYPAYRFLGLMKAVTAVISLATVVALVRIMPLALTLPGAAEANRVAQREIERRKVLESELLAARDALEQRSSQLTTKDRRIKKAMLAANAGAICWQVETNAILWEVGLLEVFRNMLGLTGQLQSWQQVMNEEEAERLRHACRLAILQDKPLLIELPVTASKGGLETLRIRGLPDQTSRDQPAVMNAFAAILPSESQMDPPPQPTR